MKTIAKRLIRFDPEQLETPAQRRDFLRGLAVAAGATTLAPLIAGRGRRSGGRLLAQGGGETEDLTDTEILQYALTLEYLEATFYLRADNAAPLPVGATADQIDPEEGGAPGSVTGLEGVTVRSPATFSVPAFVREVRDHEIIHVLTLQAALGNEALPREEFEFTFPANTFTSAMQFLAVAQALEDTGVTAYLGQVGNFDSTALLGTAATILQVEAEHASTFRFINGQPITVDNQSFDVPRSSAEVLAIAQPFIATAPPLPFP